LKELVISGESITTLQPLADCTQIEKLTLSHLSDTLSDISPLGKMLDLKECKLGYLKGVKNIKALENCTKIEKLTLSHLSNTLIDISPLKKMLDLIECQLENLTVVSDIEAVKQSFSAVSNLYPLGLWDTEAREIRGLDGVDTIESLENCPF